jgi:hypothetical protein
MDARRFDVLSISLATPDSRRSALRGLAGLSLAAGLNRFGPGEAHARKKGKKKKKKCRKLKQACNGSSLDNNCCGAAFCAASACAAGKTCCRAAGLSCGSKCDCCGGDAECENGECCIGEGGACVIIGPSHCCPGLVCDVLGSITCQPAP